MDGVTAFDNGLAAVYTDVRSDLHLFRFGDETFELPRGAVRVSRWNGMLVSLICDVREAAARAE